MPFPGTGRIWMNGRLVDWKDATIHVASHVIHYGSAVFEGARCYQTPRGSACFRLDAHMRRLQQSAKIYRMEYPLDLAGWQNAVLATIRANEMKECYIRPIVYRGYEALGVNPFACPVDASIILWKWGAYLGKEALEAGCNVSEGSGQNIFTVRDRILYTPPLASSILGGITRDSVITLARDLGFTVHESVLPREALYIADEVFVVGTAAE